MKNISDLHKKTVCFWEEAAAVSCIKAAERIR
jgi:hypothetical protein